MKNLANMMKQAQEMQAKMATMQESLSQLEVDGESAAGLVKVTMTGKYEVRTVKIDPSLTNDLEMLEDLVAAAVNDARGKAEAATQEETQKLMGGLQLPPGFKLPGM